MEEVETRENVIMSLARPSQTILNKILTLKYVTFNISNSLLCHLLFRWRQLWSFPHTATVRRYFSTLWKSLTKCGLLDKERSTSEANQDSDGSLAFVRLTPFFYFFLSSLSDVRKWLGYVVWCIARGKSLLHCDCHSRYIGICGTQVWLTSRFTSRSLIPSL